MDWTPWLPVYEVDVRFPSTALIRRGTYRCLRWLPSRPAFATRPRPARRRRRQTNWWPIELLEVRTMLSTLASAAPELSRSAIEENTTADIDQAAENENASERARRFIDHTFPVNGVTSDRFEPSNITAGQATVLFPTQAVSERKLPALPFEPEQLAKTRPPLDAEHESVRPLQPDASLSPVQKSLVKLATYRRRVVQATRNSFKLQPFNRLFEAVRSRTRQVSSEVEEAVLDLFWSSVGRNLLGMPPQVFELRKLLDNPQPVRQPEAATDHRANNHVADRGTEPTPKTTDVEAQPEQVRKAATTEPPVPATLDTDETPQPRQRRERPKPLG